MDDLGYFQLTCYIFIVWDLLILIGLGVATYFVYKILSRLTEILNVLKNEYKGVTTENENIINIEDICMEFNN